MTLEHSFSSRVVWAGSSGLGTRLSEFDPSWYVSAPGKPVLHGSHAPHFGGDPQKMNPEDLVVSAISACHMLWYLRLAAEAGMSVISYQDEPLAVTVTDENGAGRFKRVLLRPRLQMEHGSDKTEADLLHNEAQDHCVIGRSLACPIEVQAKYTFVEPTPSGYRGAFET